MKAKDIRIGDLIEFEYTVRIKYDEDSKPLIEGTDEIKLKKGLVTGKEDLRLVTIRDEDKNSSTYMQYIKYDELYMKDIHEVLELSKPLTDREKDIINFYENHISDIYSTVEDELQTARGLIDELSYQITSVENEVVGDMQERLIEHLEEQEADERRKSIQDIVGKE